MTAIYVHLLNRLRARQQVSRIFRDGQNPVDYMGNLEMLKNDRVNRPDLFQLSYLLLRHLELPVHISQPMSTSLQVCLALRYYASGSFQAVLGVVHGLKQDVCIEMYTPCLHLEEYIK